MADVIETPIQNFFAQQLIEEGLLSEVVAKQAVKDAQMNSMTLLTHLFEEQLVKPDDLARAAARFYEMPFYDLAVHEETKIPDEFISLNIVENYYGLPLRKRGDILVVAVSDPDAPDLRDLGFITGLKIEFVLVEADKLRFFISQLATGSWDEIGETDMGEFGDFDDIEFSSYEDKSAEVDTTFDVNDTPIVRFVNKMLVDAIRIKASDIHFEPYEKIYRVRYRQDGILHEVAHPPIKLSAALVARLKVMANLDISVRRVPQDGRFKLKVRKDRAVDFRISTCPTLYGEKVVMRILDPNATLLNLQLLGFEDIQLENYKKAISRTQGIILVTGPTGSGKTVSLYSALRLLNTPEKNISTIEDPVEIYMQGINQVQVNNKTGMTFANTLRSFLRQDPDIMMVGEIRDIETADIAIKAAQTGHLVLSTLHTNSAPETLSRLMNIGVKPYNVASSVILVMAQRLVRRLCENCKVEVDHSKEELELSGFHADDLNEDMVFYGPKGCSQCVNGYVGREAIFEVLPISDEMRRLIMKAESTLTLAEQANKEGVRSLRRSGITKVIEGVTSLEELNRVTDR